MPAALARNPKIETKTNVKYSTTGFEMGSFRSFEFVSDFGFGASDFQT
jgi:hypothetical protein